MGNCNPSEIRFIPNNDFQRMLWLNDQLEVIEDTLNGSPDLVKTCFSHYKIRSDIGTISSNKVFPCLFVVCQMGSAKLAKCLIDHGADVSEVVRGWTPLSFAVDANSAQTVGVLLSNGADYLSCSDPLHLAVSKGELEVLKEFQRHGLDVVSYREVDEWTLLMHSANNKAMTKYLIQQGVPLDACTTKKGYSAIHIFAYGGAIESIGILLEEGVNINQPSTKKHHSPLYAAVIGKELETCKYLLSKGADPNLPSSSGRTPLQKAINMDSTELIKLLSSYN